MVGENQWCAVIGNTGHKCACLCTTPSTLRHITQSRPIRGSKPTSASSQTAFLIANQEYANSFSKLHKHYPITNSSLAATAGKVRPCRRTSTTSDTFLRQITMVSIAHLAPY